MTIKELTEKYYFEDHTIETIKMAGHNLLVEFSYPSDEPVKLSFINATLKTNVPSEGKFAIDSVEAIMEKGAVIGIGFTSLNSNNYGTKHYAIINATEVERLEV